MKKRKNISRRMAGLAMVLCLNGLAVESVVAQMNAQGVVQAPEQLSDKAWCGKWKIERQGEGVTLSSRWLEFGDALKTRELLLSFVVSSDMDYVCRNLKCPAQLRAWNDGVRELNLLESGDSVWITHIVYAVPPPFLQQDLVIKNIMRKENHRVTITMHALPDYIPPLKNVNRQKHYFGRMELKARENRNIAVRFSVISLSKSKIPRFIRDPIIQHKLYTSFVKLKEISSEQQNNPAL